VIEVVPFGHLSSSPASNQPIGLWVQPLSCLATALKSFPRFHRLVGQFREHAFLVIIALSDPDVPSRLGQFASQRLGGDYLAGLSDFADVPAPALLVVALREVGRCHKCPGQILVAAFLIVLGFTLAMAQPRAWFAELFFGN